MYIEKLDLTNYRGIPSLELNLHHKLNIFYGMNGSGKSTALDAIAIMLSWAVSRIRHAGTSGRPIQEEDITNGKSVATLKITCESNSGTINWKLVKNRQGYSITEDRTDLSTLSQYAKEMQREIALSREKVNLPIFVYYPVNRAVLDVVVRIRRKHKFNLMAAYDEALKGGANFRLFFEWFREREDLENENRKYVDHLFKPEGFQYPDRQLEAVRSALLSLLPEFRNLTVRRNPLRMEVEKNGKRLKVDQLSDGEKCLIAMVSDLARRLAIANPVSNYPSKHNPLEGEGIVLIDEIDLHLHPKWQRMIIPKLVDVFPNCQFIVSTHSPHVLTHVKPESLFMLKETSKGIILEKPIESYGKNTDRILEDLMGLETTRPDHISTRIHELFEEIDVGHIAEAERIIRELKAEIGEDPELTKAEVLIKRRKIIGK